MKDIKQVLFEDNTDDDKDYIEIFMNQVTQARKKLYKEIIFHEAQLRRLDGPILESSIFYQDVYKKSKKNPLLTTARKDSSESSDEDSNIEDRSIKDKKRAVKIHLKNLRRVDEIVLELAVLLDKNSPYAEIQKAITLIGDWFATALKRWDIAAICYRTAAMNHYQAAIDKLSDDFMQSLHMTYHARMVVKAPSKRLIEEFKQLALGHTSLFYALCEQDDWSTIKTYLGASLTRIISPSKLVDEEKTDIPPREPVGIDLIMGYVDEQIKHRLAVTDYVPPEEDQCQLCQML